MLSYLPCKKCGNALPIIKGSVAKCPYCGARTLYMESIYSFKYYLNEILHLTSIKKDRNINDSEIKRRKSLFESFFYKLSSDFKEYRHIIITKLDSINIDPIKLYNLIRSAGNFEIIIEEFLLKHLKNENIRKKYQEFRDLAYIINKSSLGLYFSYLAKNSSYLENCSKYYHFAEKSFQNIVDFCNITNFESNHSKLYKKKGLYEIITEFALILRGILNKNPKYYSDKLENLLFKLNKIKTNDFQKYTLYAQIESIYQLERDTSVLLEKVKLDNPFLSPDPPEEDIIFNTEENLEKLNNVTNWIHDISEKYQKYQRNLLKLHSGKFIKYLESYRTHFINYKNRNLEKFNILLENIVSKAFNSYNSETIEVLNTLSDFIHNNIFNEKIIERIEIELADLVKLDDMLKKFINEIFKKPLIRNLKSDYYKKLISFTSNKHSEFDKHILKCINRMLQEFQEVRSKKILSLEEQKNQFSLEFKPNLQKLINLSFNLDKDALEYPLFIDIKLENNILKKNQSESIKLVIENPNLSEIKDIKIYFFLPNSFLFKTKSTSIKRLKANERRTIKTKITPIKTGTFLYMVMIEYQYTNKTFWMPSIKLELKVDRAEEILKYQYYNFLHMGIYHDEIEASRIFNNLRILV
ncbi:MAG: hypothetical protein HWN81_18190 [Candidatus Lokiarchaeota archaeon]|nr:hypothetical protein [Candidatus Lokiarchaeota archaeon]